MRIDRRSSDRNGLESLLKNKRISAYSGIDPTAPSLHLGHMLPMMVMYWLYVHGHRAISVVSSAMSEMLDYSSSLVDRRWYGKSWRSYWSSYIPRDYANFYI